MGAVDNVCLPPGALEPTHRKGDSFGWTRTKFTLVLVELGGFGEAKHPADDPGVVEIPAITNACSTDIAAEVVSNLCSAVQHL